MDGPLNVTGVAFPGVSGVIAGQTAYFAWGTTSLIPAVYDIFQDRLIRDDPGCPAALCIESAGELHAVEERSEAYRLNLVGDGVFDNSVDVTSIVSLQAPETVNVLVAVPVFGGVSASVTVSVMVFGPAEV